MWVLISFFQSGKATCSYGGNKNIYWVEEEICVCTYICTYKHVTYFSPYPRLLLYWNLNSFKINTHTQNIIVSFKSLKIVNSGLGTIYTS